MTLGERIRKIRNEVAGGISQTEFAELLGIGRSELSNIEGDRLKNPEQKKPLFMLISSQFGVSLDWIVNEAGPMRYPQPDTDMELINALLEDEPAATVRFVKRFMRGYLQLTPDRQAVIDEVLEELSKQE